MKIVMAAIFCMAAMCQPAHGEAQVSGPSALQTSISMEACWIPPKGAVNRIREKCGFLQVPAFGECFVSAMKDEGASTQAMAFAGRMDNLAYMTRFLETGRVDVAYVEWPFRANENYSWFIVNGAPDLIDVDDPAYRAKTGFEKDARYTSLAKIYPRLALWPDDRSEKSIPMVKSLKGQGQRFVISNRITDGCRACSYLGTAWFAFDFTQNGTFLGTKFLGIEKVPRESTTMTLANSVEQGFTNPKKPVEAEAGQKFTIILGANRTTGYRWEIASSPDIKTVELVGSEYKASDTQKVGSGGREVWTFLAKNPGKTKVVFKYVRPWEKGAGPAKTSSFEIIVR